jgi:hypothetical protein
MRVKMLPWLLVIAAIVVTGCADITALTVADISKQPDAYLGKDITVRGVLAVDVLDVPHLYMSDEDAEAHKDLKAIDVVSDNRSLYEALQFRKPTCKIVEGTFHISGKDYVTTGSFVSKIGFIKVTRMKACH